MLAGLALGGAAVAAAAAEWPGWRGANRDAISKETGLLKDWDKDAPRPEWEAKGLGAGYSAPSVAGGRVYVMGEDAKSSYVRALDAKDGTILWSAPVGKIGGNYEGPRSTPTVDADHVYAIGQFSDLVCVSAKDGKEVWRKNLLADFKGKLMEPPVWGFAESPLVDGDQLICTPGGPEGTLIALDKRTSGKTLWRSKDFTDATAYASARRRDRRHAHVHRADQTSTWPRHRCQDGRPALERRPPRAHGRHHPGVRQTAMCS